MFVDASALVAILNRESDADFYWKRLQEHPGPVYYSDIVLFEGCQAMARARALEMQITLKMKPDLLREAWDDIAEFFGTLGAIYIPITSEVGVEAIHASRRFGKVVGHAAALNLGDCYSYACAKVRNLGLLYKGLDFASTDLA